uniref:Replication protein A C-terminal domain-containing protein n=1 Tax=Spumella elongata TaxID=89044 RepID=A0A7S3GU06_9STRA
MSYGGFEYGNNNQYGGFDPMGGYGGNYGMDGGGAGGFMGGEPEVKSSEKKKVGDRQSLIPVTIKQIQSADRQGDQYIVDGREIHTVQLVGTFSGLEEHSTNILFRLNDGTGLLECRQWIDKESLKHKKVAGLKPGSMVRVVGNIRDYEGSKHILVFEIFAVEDFNQLTNHLLNVVLTHCIHTKGPIPGDNSGANKPGIASNNFSSGSPAGRPTIGGSNNMGFNNNAGFNMNSMNQRGGSSLNAVKSETQGLTETIYQAYTGRSSANQEGLPLQAALQILRTKGVNLQPHELLNHVRQLCDDGRLYSTIDDEHHKPTSEDF